MIGLIASLLLQASAMANAEPADWRCADPFIERNYGQRVEARQLALRIADECARRYVPRPIITDADRHFETMDRTTYNYRLASFQFEIEGKIGEARRRSAIKLN